MAKLPTLTKAFLGERIEANSSETARPSTTGPDGVSELPPMSSSTAYAGIGEGVKQSAPTTASGEPLNKMQATSALLVGGIVGGLLQTGALGNSEASQEVVKAAGQRILENSDLSTNTASSVVAAAGGDKNAQVDLGIKAVNALSNNAISEDTGRMVVGALEGDKAAQQKLILKTVNALSNDSPLAPTIKAVGELGQKAIDSIFPQGSALRNLASDFLGKEVKKLSNDAPVDNPPPRIISSTGVSRLQKIRQRKDPLFSFDWKVELPNIGNTGANVSGDIFNFYVEEVSITLPTFQANEFFRNGSRKKFPGFYDVGTITLSFYEDREMTTSAYLNHWHSKIHNRKSAYYNLPSTYKKTFYVYCFDAKGKNVGLFKVLDAWPTTAGSYSLQSSSTDRVILQVEFSTDGILFQRVQNGVPVSNAIPVASAVKESANYSGPINAMLQAVGLNSTISGPISKVANSFLS